MPHRLFLWSPQREGRNSRHPRGKNLGTLVNLNINKKNRCQPVALCQSLGLKLLDNGESWGIPSEGTELPEPTMGPLRVLRQSLLTIWNGGAQPSNN